MATASTADSLTPFEQAVVCYKTDVEFEELERLMMNAIKQEPKNPIRPKTLPGVPTEAIEEWKMLCDNAYGSNELRTMSELYEDAFEWGIDWIPSFKARMALGFAVTGKIGQAYRLATESYIEHPEEIDAYFSMARIMRYLNSPFQARKWLELFKNGCKTMTFGATEFEKVIDADIRFCA